MDQPAIPFSLTPSCHCLSLFVAIKLCSPGEQMQFPGRRSARFTAIWRLVLNGLRQHSRHLVNKFAATPLSFFKHQESFGIWREKSKLLLRNLTSSLAGFQMARDSIDGDMQSLQKYHCKRLTLTLLIVPVIVICGETIFYSIRCTASVVTESSLRVEAEVLWQKFFKSLRPWALR